MSDLLEELFGLAMDRLPYSPDPARDKAEEALEELLDKEGKRLLRAYDEICGDHNWDDLKHIFYTGLSLGIELATLKPCAGACRR